MQMSHRQKTVRRVTSHKILKNNKIRNFNSNDGGNVVFKYLLPTRGPNTTILYMQCPNRCFKPPFWVRTWSHANSNNVSNLVLKPTLATKIQQRCFEPFLGNAPWPYNGVNHASIANIVCIDPTKFVMTIVGQTRRVRFGHHMCDSLHSSGGCNILIRIVVRFPSCDQTMPSTFVRFAYSLLLFLPVTCAILLFYTCKTDTWGRQTVVVKHDTPKLTKRNAHEMFLSTFSRTYLRQIRNSTLWLLTVPVPIDGALETNQICVRCNQLDYTLLESTFDVCNRLVQKHAYA